MVIKHRSQIQWLTLVSLFTALITVGAYLRIPTPFIPITFQVFFVLLAGLLLGPKYGAYSGILYMLLGLMGVPVFTEGGGFGYIFKPSFGYIIGFVFGAYVTGKASQEKERKEGLNFTKLFLAVLLGIATIYIFGITYFIFISKMILNLPLSISAILMYGFITVIPGDLITGALAATLAKRLRPVLKRAQGG